MYDIAIVGGGPAGVSAAVNAKLLDLNLIWFSGGGSSKKVEAAPLIKNYIGLPDISGKELGLAIKNHAESMGITPVQKVVNGIYPAGNYFTLTSGQETYEAKSVVLCVGVQSAKSVDGEEKFVGKGISYCATCDGLLYRGKTVAVICTDKQFEHEIKFLCGLAQRAYVAALYRGCGITADNAEIILEAPQEFQGGEKVEQVRFKSRTVDVDGVFILKSFFSPSSLLHGLKTEGGHVVCDRAMRTNIAGVFCAGDCTGRPYQYMKAAGEGNIAAHSAAEYLAAAK